MIPAKNKALGFDPEGLQDLDLAIRLLNLASNSLNASLASRKKLSETCRALSEESRHGQAKRIWLENNSGRYKFEECLVAALLDEINRRIKGMK